MYNYLLHFRTYLTIKQKQLADSFSSRKTRSYTPFVILCEPRTGSTLLHTYLNFHPSVKSYGEALREKKEKGIRLSDRPVSRFVFKPHAPQIRAVGLKLFYSYYQHPSYQVAFQEILEKKGVKVIHLIREDVLQQYVSLTIARQTKEWSASRSSGSSRSRKLLIDLEDLRLFLMNHFQKKSLFNSLFKEHEMLTISYEQLKDESQIVLADVQKFLGVKPRKLLSLLQKQNRRPIESFVENYTEARALVDKMTLESEE